MNRERPNLSNVHRFDGLSRDQVGHILERITKLRAGVIGDGCLDMYWHADMTRSELSRETPHHNLPVIGEHYAPGAAGNVAVNFKRLGCKEVRFSSVIGADWRGELLRQSLQGQGIDDRDIIIAENRTTPAYCKTIRHGLQNVAQEDPRLDFINLTAPDEQTVSAYIAAIDQMAEQVDMISVTDQLQHGSIVDEVRVRLHHWAAQGKIIVVDSRDQIGSYKGMITKPNEIESLRWYYGNLDFKQSGEEEMIHAGFKLSRHSGAPCCMTMGERGALWFEDGNCTYIPTAPVEPPIDIVGAGDTYTAAIASALAAGCSGPEAAAFAHLASAVSITKLAGVGTASPDEILARHDRVMSAAD